MSLLVGMELKLLATLSETKMRNHEVNTNDILYLSLCAHNTTEISLTGKITQVTERGIKFQPSDAPVKHSIWLPKRAIEIEEVLTLENIPGQYFRGKLKKPFNPNSFQYWVIAGYCHVVSFEGA